MFSIAYRMLGSVADAEDVVGHLGTAILTRPDKRNAVSPAMARRLASEEFKQAISRG